jgi:flagellar basal body-associated protein FliL
MEGGDILLVVGIVLIALGIQAIWYYFTKKKKKP